MSSIISCPDCSASSPASVPSSRRSFLKTAAAGSLAWAGLPIIGQAAEETKSADSETLVTQLFKSLNEEQKSKVCFPFDNPLRSRVDNNWMIVDKSIAEIFTPEQQSLVKQIFNGLHRDEYVKSVYGQVVHDSGGEGFEKSCAVAIFGEPGTGKFEFVLTGRHCTRRCDGDSVEGAAFGGPIFYGHAAESFNEKADHPGNVYWYQAKRVNEVFAALDGKQREAALLDEGREEKHSSTVKLSGKKEGLQGLAYGDLAKDQQGLMDKVMADLLAPFRKKDADEAMKLIKDSGMNDLHLAFFKSDDIGNDKIWDTWQIEGPNMVWYFRGAPHVHCWVNIQKGAAA